MMISSNARTPPTMPAMSGMVELFRNDSGDPDALVDPDDDFVSAAAVQMHTSSSLLIISVLSLFLRFS